MGIDITAPAEQHRGSTVCARRCGLWKEVVAHGQVQLQADIVATAGADATVTLLLDSMEEKSSSDNDIASKQLFA